MQHAHRSGFYDGVCSQLLEKVYCVCFVKMGYISCFGKDMSPYSVLRGRGEHLCPPPHLFSSVLGCRILRLINLKACRVGIPGMEGLGRL